MRRLIPLLAIAGLAACHADPEPGTRTAKALIAQRCASCHVVPGVRTAVGRVGPSLKGIATQQIIAGRYENTPGNMKRWIMHPQHLLPGTAMPDTGLTDAQAEAIVDYLNTLDG
ncbi:c-type cytochrome [Stakelama saccharophila]|uniref:C-type cytochrome n=1 Tax=Stakelama saccharophila TaxID=3075605 RepID=A0ABZ0B5N7_9SPHN|nr:c-type cytochrome [Stakelama sp. W311]WNO52700.1 c-type cytochrome [Stakelama sp. W311]